MLAAGDELHTVGDVSKCNASSIYTHIGDEIHMDFLAESLLALHTRLIVWFCIPITVSAWCDAVEGTRYLLNSYLQDSAIGSDRDCESNSDYGINSGYNNDNDNYCDSDNDYNGVLPTD